MAMDNQPALPSLDVWTSALLTKSSKGRGSNGKLEAYGIKKLRELILELAVRGKLVPQDPIDEPASVLLERITKEKARLIHEGRIRKEKPLPEITEENQHFELPAGWVFVRLGNIALSQAGFAFKSRFFNENRDGLPLIRIRDVGQPFTGTYYSGEYREEFVVESGDYLISMDGEFRVSPWANGQALLNQRVSRLIFYYADVGQRFIADSLQARLRGLQGVKAYTTVDHLSGTQIAESVIGLPPLAEQHRIVAKVDELMALCDQLERQQTDSLAAQQTLVETLLGTLTRVESQQEFSAAWTRIASHFDTLFTTEASIDQLKQTLLQLAVMGRLVPQDPSDEPVTLFLARIGKEKQRLISEGKAKKDKPLPSLTGGMPFELPESWRWVSFEDVVDISSGVTLGRKVSGKRLVTTPYLRVANVQRGYLDLEQMKEIELTEQELDKYSVIARDLLITEGGDWDKVGRTAIWRDELPQVAHQNHVFKARRFLDEQNEVWLEKYLNSEVARNYFAGSSKQTTNLASINKTQLRGCPVAMPPINEQHRIVAKVDQLMALCDALKARLADAQAIQVHLADAIVEQAVC